MCDFDIGHQYYHKNTLKGQAAVEYMIVVSIGLLFISPILIMGQSTLNDMKEKSRISTVQSSLDKLTEAIEVIHAQGHPARMKVKIRWPSGITSSGIDETTDTIWVRVNKLSGDEDILRFFDYNVSGTLPSSEGVHVLNVEALPYEVNISVE